jgi:hypothetical protein
MALWRRLPEPNEPYSLRKMALAVEDAVAYVNLAQDNSPEVRAQVLGRKSVALIAVGRREEALTIAREAADLYRQLDKANPDAVKVGTQSHSHDLP